MMKRFVAIGASVCALPLAFSAAPTQAQYMPHLDPQLYANIIMQMNQGYVACLPMPEHEIDEARLPAPGVMQAYFDAAQAGEPISDQFKLESETRWTYGNISVGRDRLDEMRDPLAVPGNRFDPNTLRFFRAGTHQTAQGQWLVLAADGSVAGVYNGLFERQRGEWRLMQLEIFTADQRVAPIMHYCNRPGDMDEGEFDAAQAQVEQLERRLQSRTRRYERLDELAREAEERAARDPDNRRRAERAAERRARADDRYDDVREARQALNNARVDLAQARAELAELRALTTQARYAQGFRLLDNEGRRIDRGKKAENRETELREKASGGG